MCALSTNALITYIAEGGGGGYKSQVVKGLVRSLAQIQELVCGQLVNKIRHESGRNHTQGFEVEQIC